MLVSVVSFGYRYGVPSDADLFSTSISAQPPFRAALRPSRAKTRKGKNISGRFPQTGNSLRRMEGLLNYLIRIISAKGKVICHCLRHAQAESTAR